MTQDEIIEMARESGMELYGLGKDRARFVYHLVAFTNLVAAKEREALAQPEQEPVATLFGSLPVYDTTTPQRTWVGLTDEQIAEIENEYIVDYRIPAGSAWNFAKDIEAKLKEKNT